MYKSKRPTLHLLCAIFLLVLISSVSFGQNKYRTVESPVPGQFIVVLDDGVTDVATAAANLSAQYGGTVGFIYDSVFKGYSVSMKTQPAINLSGDPLVKYVTQDNAINLQSDVTQTDAPWNLDRIDQRDLPLSTTYAYPDTLGRGVMVYILDSGIRDHFSEFSNSPNSSGRVFPGPNFYGGSNQDCDGHGTHVAGIIGGSTYGVSKRPFLIPVKVFGCTGQPSNASAVIAGINWVKTNSANVIRKVTNMSFGGPVNTAMDDAVRSLIASGMPVVIAAGNDGNDAGNHSPSRIRDAIVVGNVNVNDGRDPTSNFGTAVDVFAPGENITSAGFNNSYAVKSGTSQAAPHVTGDSKLHLLIQHSWYRPTEISSGIGHRECNCQPAFQCRARIAEFPAIC